MPFCPSVQRLRSSTMLALQCAKDLTVKNAFTTVNSNIAIATKHLPEVLHAHHASIMHLHHMYLLLQLLKRT